MTITISIKADNAAFEDDDLEIVRILERIAEDIRNAGEFLRDDWDGYPLRDVNGNKVGVVKVRGK